MNSPAIRFNGQVEYALDGDFAKLGAHLDIDAPEQIAEERLSLQLWACDEYFDTTAPQNTRIASLPLQPLLFSGFYSDQAQALPPAGNRDYLIAMALVGENAEGGERVHDVALFNNRQLFTQPRIYGRVDSQVLEGCIELRIESIANPRDEQNLSGSLSLEVWALNQPYTGGAFTGFQLGGCELGALNGGAQWRDNLFTLNMEQPPAGEWSLVLMLREWTSAGYLTRDYRQLCELVQQPTAAAPLAVEQQLAPIEMDAPSKDVEPQTLQAEPAAQPAPAKKAGKAEAAGKKASAPVAKKAVKAAVETKRVEAKEKAATKAKAEVQAKAAVKPAAKSAVKTAPKAEAKAELKADVKESKAQVSINKAGAEALAAVRGLSPRLAKEIIAERPYASLDQLTKVRGLGAKTVAKLKKFLCL
ncbi:ComEA family DNA-binding protein [Marinobacterium lutimaris]|uniref:DNA uptake protein ComE n=1 Tax=Marinobacterium lutimaris TaxID=568106 RepID=A0A1H5X251_9GAMM|nr:helix-hairpin-helix domain-containing protein [Marinobacterium lutimaris]SEG05440.1 DNA uptake protein ComE [Marinobacterium lutimaris]